MRIILSLFMIFSLIFMDFLRLLNRGDNSSNDDTSSKSSFKFNCAFTISIVVFILTFSVLFYVDFIMAPNFCPCCNY